MSIQEKKQDMESSIVQVVGVVQDVTNEEMESLIVTEPSTNLTLANQEPVAITEATEHTAVDTATVQQIQLMSHMEGVEMANIDEDERRNKSLEALFQVRPWSSSINLRYSGRINFVHTCSLVVTL